MVFSWLNVSILLGLLVGFGFAAGPLVGAWLLAPRARGGDMGIPYECGLRPHGSAWVRFGINYYFYALLFLAFDVDVLYLFPVAAHYPDSVGFLPLIKVFIFLFALALGCFYFWKKGVFEWPHKIQFDQQ
ncbi:MAG: NADH-quinone oxidoreductase subunit A [Desulfovibrio sp.]|mgnify:CR=1 FL=1|nr:MAG: NADH-quinone oxidoreductase subunit A [Desulfovibrio sp.]